MVIIVTVSNVFRIRPGLWLEHLGFQHGQRIEIMTERQRLVLTVFDDNSELPTN